MGQMMPQYYSFTQSIDRKMIDVMEYEVNSEFRIPN